MRTVRSLLFVAAGLCCVGCEKTPVAETTPEERVSSEAPTPAAGENTEAAPQEESPTAAPAKANGVKNEAAEAKRAARLKQRLGVLFEDVLPTLDDTRELVDRHGTLPESSFIPFKTDQQSNTEDINELLDEAITQLAVSEVSDYRQRIRDANESISNSQRKIAESRQKRVSAKSADEQSQLEKVNPFDLSREELEDQIEAEKANIEKQREKLVQLKKTFADELSRIGVEVDTQGVESLLSSVSGDDIVQMAVVFDNIKHVTTQLQELTEESGEALEVSKRYYGMYVVMVQVMDRIQKNFIRDVNGKHIPKLQEFVSQADLNIERAKKLIEGGGGDKKLLTSNISSNRVTRETAELYIEYLRQNAELIAAENKRAQKNIATAMNTYDTVKLSSDVAELMKSGRRDFEALMRLRVPALRPFSNEAIRREFQRMTVELRGDS